MKRSTAIDRLSDAGEGLDRAAQWPSTTISAAFVYGDLLEDQAELDRVQLAFVVSEPAEAVPWMSRPAHLEALAASVRFTKLPLSWCWRPDEWPVWNHAIPRAVRFWTADGGTDHQVIEAVTTGSWDDVAIAAPANDDELVGQLLVERDVGRRYLTTVVERFHDRDWRRSHRGDGIYPEDHLWSATVGFLDLDDATVRMQP